MRPAPSAHIWKAPSTRTVNAARARTSDDADPFVIDLIAQATDLSHSQRVDHLSIDLQATMAVNDDTITIDARLFRFAVAIRHQLGLFYPST